MFFWRQLQVLVSFMLVLSAVSLMCLHEFKNAFVVVVDDLLSIIHTAVTDLDCVTIKDFSMFVVFQEVLVY